MGKAASCKMFSTDDQILYKGKMGAAEELISESISKQQALSQQGSKNLFLLLTPIAETIELPSTHPIPTVVDSTEGGESL